MVGVLLAAALGASSPDAVAIEVEGVGYTLAAARATVQELRTRLRITSPEQLVGMLRSELLVAVDARRSGLAKSPDAMSAVSVARNRKISALFAEQELSKGLSPTDAELKALFHAAGDSVKLQIVVFSSAGEADAAVKRVAAGGPFAAEVKVGIPFKSANAEGATGFLRRGSVEQALVGPAFERPIGKVFGPVALATGFAAVVVLDRAIANEAEFPPERDRLAALWKSQALGAVRSHFLGAERAKRPVAIDDAFLRGLGGRLDATEQEAKHVVARVGKLELTYRELFPVLASLAPAAGSSHMAGATVKEMMIREYLDDVVVAAAATDLGFAARPDVAGRLARAENAALVQAWARAFITALPDSTKPSEVQPLIDRAVADLAKKYRVRVDDLVVREAL
jgi:hypothetical protein